MSPSSGSRRLDAPCPVAGCRLELKPICVVLLLLSGASGCYDTPGYGIGTSCDPVTKPCREPLTCVAAHCALETSSVAGGGVAGSKSVASGGTSASGTGATSAGRPPEAAGTSATNLTSAGSAVSGSAGTVNGGVGASRVDDGGNHGTTSAAGAATAAGNPNSQAGGYAGSGGNGTAGIASWWAGGTAIGFGGAADVGGSTAGTAGSAATGGVNGGNPSIGGDASVAGSQSSGGRSYVGGTSPVAGVGGNVAGAPNHGGVGNAGGTTSEAAGSTGVGCTGGLESMTAFGGASLCVANMATIDGSGGIPAYRIDVSEVTRGQYETWVRARPALPIQTDPNCGWKSSGNYDIDSYCLDSSHVCATNCGHHPVVCVDWCDAREYCVSVGKRLCGKIGGGSITSSVEMRDATKSQWYRACSSAGVNIYTYGNEVSYTNCNGSEYWAATPYGSMTVEVGTLPQCHSNVDGYQVAYDLSGNVSEWQDDELPFFYRRGGSFHNWSEDLRCDVEAYVYFVESDPYVSEDVGFRCCSDSP
jgi:formylglycine-generating enzyme